MLSKGEAGKLSKEQKKMVEDAFESAKRMAGLINDLLNVTGLDSGKTKLSPKPTDLVKLAKKVLKHYEPEIKKSGVELSLEEPASNFGKIKIDPNLIEQALDNLVSNAVKYTPKGGKITLKIEKKEDEALITVKDTGIGIPASIQRDIFKKFYRSKRAISVHPEGTGLGLFIAKNAVEMSGGRIWFESEEGAGTTFYVALPLEPPSRGKTKEK